MTSLCHPAMLRVAIAFASWCDELDVVCTLIRGPHASDQTDARIKHWTVLPLLHGLVMATASHADVCFQAVLSGIFSCADLAEMRMIAVW